MKENDEREFNLDWEPGPEVEEAIKELMEELNDPATPIDVDPRRVFEGIHHKVMESERRLARKVIRGLDDAEAAAMDEVRLIHERDRRIKRAGLIGRFLLRLRFKMDEWIIRLKFALWRAQERQRELKEKRNG